MINLPFDLKNDPKKTLLLIILAAVVAFVLYFLFLLKPQVVRLTGIFADMGRVSNELREANTNIAKIGQFKTNIEAYKEKVDEYEKRLPAEQEIPSLLENLSTMAKSSNIKMLAITPTAMNSKEVSRPKTGQVYQEMPILINAKSGYHELGNFLSNLENADRFMKVVDIDMKANKLIPKKHDVELIVSTFILLKEK